MAGVAVVSGDGLVIEEALGPGTDPDGVAALATTVARHGGELGTAAGLGSLATAVLEYEGAPAVIGPLGGGASLVVVARPGTDLGGLLYLLRHHRGAIADLL